MRGMKGCGFWGVIAVLFVAGVGMMYPAELKRPVLARVSPNYPEVARRMHVEGTVMVEVTAMPDGSVSHVHAVSGHPLLMQAAEDCVAHWRFMMMPKSERGTVPVVFSLE